MVYSSRHSQVYTTPRSVNLWLTLFPGMSQQQPQLYATLTSALGPEEQQVIKAALDHADKVAAEQQAAGAAPRAGPNGAPVQANGA